MQRIAITFCIMMMTMISCRQTPTAPDASTEPSAAIPEFSADSAMSSIVKQCSFGPRVPGTDAHRQCAEYIAQTFQSLGAEIVRQEATLTRYDGQTLPACNIIARTSPEKQRRLLLASHWDSRPWADHDANSANHHSPILGANDGASGVAVMMEIARIVADSVPNVGLDFVCFDAEDAGTPEWDERNDDDNDQSTWCLGSQYWAAHPHARNFEAAILLDMVGGYGARFYREGFSLYFAPALVDKVWQAARAAGYESFFPNSPGGYVTDDHLPVNQVAGIRMIDVVPHYPAGTSSFGPTWHTMQDSPENIDPNTLKAVGQTMLYLIYTL